MVKVVPSFLYYLPQLNRPWQSPVRAQDKGQSLCFQGGGETSGITQISYPVHGPCSSKTIIAETQNWLPFSIDEHI